MIWSSLPCHPSYKSRHKVSSVLAFTAWSSAKEILQRIFVWCRSFLNLIAFAFHYSPHVCINRGLQIFQKSRSHAFILELEGWYKARFLPRNHKHKSPRNKTVAPANFRQEILYPCICICVWMYIYACVKILGDKNHFCIVVLRLSPCSECGLYSSGNFPGVWSSDAGEIPRRIQTTRTTSVSNSYLFRIFFFRFKFLIISCNCTAYMKHSEQILPVVTWSDLIAENLSKAFS